METPARADGLVGVAYALVEEQFSLEQLARAALTAFLSSVAPRASGSG